MNWSGRPYRPYYPRSVPRRVEGGLRLPAKRGAVAETWWGQRWTQALESFGWHTRLERGRRYARAGQVASISIEPGQVRALVQGSRAEPYRVRISLHCLPRKGWSRAADAISRKALFTAQLLSGRMPREILGAFSEWKLDLFPKARRDLATECTCPDWENPCKHIAAVHYILAAEFDRDPFLLFRLRGMPREEFLAEIRARRSAVPPPRDPDAWTPAHAPAAATRPAASRPPRADLSQSLEAFYRVGKELPAGWGPSASGLERLPVPGAKIRELGRPPFWRGSLGFESTLERYCQLARERALALARGA